jgi:hypothetical protein
MKWLILPALIASTRPADAKGCHETSGVVGYHHCTWFGLWSRDLDMPRLIIDVGFMHRRFTSEPFVLTGDPRAVDAAAGSDLATGVSMPGVYRILFGLGPLSYAGFDLGGGWLSRPPHELGETAATTFMGAAHLIGGLHVNPLWRVSTGVELAAGGRIVALSSCTTRPCPADSVTYQDRRELEARALVDLWLTPRFSIGGGYGHSLIDRDDWTWMVYLGIHIRPMDGML